MPDVEAEFTERLGDATVQSIGMDVVDTFYVRSASGGLVTDPEHRREVIKAVLHAVS